MKNNVDQQIEDLEKRILFYFKNISSSTEGLHHFMRLIELNKLKRSLVYQKEKATKTLSSSL